jgi:hypothetical protein
MKTLVLTKTQLDRWSLDIFATIVLFLFIYAPSFHFFPINISYVVILLAMAYISYGNNLDKLLTLFRHKSFATFLLFYFFSMLYILLIPTFSDWPFDKTFVVTFIRLLLDIILVLPFFILIFCQDLDYRTDDFLKLIVKIGVIQGVIATVMFVIPGFKEFIFGYFIELPSEKLLNQPYRGYGISNDYYFSSPLFQGLVFVVNSILYIKTSKKKYLLFYPFILISMALNARISLIIIPIFFVVVFMSSFYYDNLQWLRKFSGLFLIFIALVSIIILYFVSYPEKAQSILWISDGVLGGVGALSGDIRASRTLSIIISEHLHFPQRQFNLWFGEGLVVFANPKSYIRSDLGYIRYIYYGGIVFSLLFYFSIINFSISSIIKTKDPLIKILLLTLLVTSFSVHFKGDIFNSSAFLKGFLLLLILTIHNSNPQSLDAK